MDFPSEVRFGFPEFRAVEKNVHVEFEGFEGILLIYVWVAICITTVMFINILIQMFTNIFINIYMLHHAVAISYFLHLSRLLLSRWEVPVIITCLGSNPLGIVCWGVRLPNSFLVGGFNPSEKYSSNWQYSPNRGENKKYLKPPPSYYLTLQQRRRTVSHSIPLLFPIPSSL